MYITIYITYWFISKYVSLIFYEWPTLTLRSLRWTSRHDLLDVIIHVDVVFWCLIESTWAWLYYHDDGYAYGNLSYNPNKNTVCVTMIWCVLFHNCIKFGIEVYEHFQSIYIVSSWCVFGFVTALLFMRIHILRCLMWINEKGHKAWVYICSHFCFHRSLYHIIVWCDLRIIALLTNNDSYLKQHTAIDYCTYHPTVCVWKWQMKKNH